MKSWYHRNSRSHMARHMVIRTRSASAHLCHLYLWVASRPFRFLSITKALR